MEALLMLPLKLTVLIIYLYYASMISLNSRIIVTNDKQGPIR